MFRFMEIYTPEGTLAKHTDALNRKIICNIDRKAGGRLCTAEISIYNMSQETMSLIKIDDPISVRAGSDTKSGVIFSGQIINSFVSREGADIRHILLCKSPHLEDMKVAPVSLNYKSVYQLVKKVAETTGRGVEIKPSDFVNYAPLARGVSLSGNAVENMDKLADRFGLTVDYSREGLIRISTKDSVSTPNRKTISIETGMIGVPTFIDEGVEVKFILDPDVNIDDGITIDSKYRSYNFSGAFHRRLDNIATKFKILEMSILADTLSDSGEDWSMNIRCIPDRGV